MIYLCENVSQEEFVLNLQPLRNSLGFRYCYACYMIGSFCDCDCDCNDCLGCLQTVPWLITLDLYAAMSLLRVK